MNSPSLPQAFERIEFSGFLMEYMNYDVCIIEDYPVWPLITLGFHGGSPFSFNWDNPPRQQALLPALACTCCDDEVVCGECKVLDLDNF